MNEEYFKEERLKRGAIEIGTQEDQEKGLFDLLDYLEEKGIKLDKMIEIGTWRGGSALIFSQRFNEVMCIDHWLGDKFLPNVYEEFLHNIRKDPNIKHMRGKSEMLHQHFEDESVDFVYVDGDHRGEFVRQDIENWLPKVKPNGAIAGHDYGRIDKPGGFNFEELTEVVDSFGKPKTFVDTSWLLFKKDIISK